MTERRSSAKPQHPIGVAAERTGLTPDVLRVWERRYGVVSPTRSDGHQRLYSDDDVERLRLLHLATLPGRSISQVVKLSTNALAQLVEEDTIARARVGTHGSAGDPAADAVEQGVSLVRAYDTRSLEWLLRRAATVLGLPEFLESVAAPLLRRLGDEWHAGRLTTGQEHLATSLVRRVIIGAMQWGEVPHDAPNLVVATPAGERHEIGALFVAAAAMTQGWSVTYLGADLPAKDIVETAQALDARGVALSVIYSAERRHLLREIREIRDRLPAHVFVIVGGSGAMPLRDELATLGIPVGERLADLGEAVRR